MQYAPFTIKETLLFGFHAFKNNLVLLLGVSLLSLGLELTSQMIITMIAQQGCFTVLTITGLSCLQDLRDLACLGITQILFIIFIKTLSWLAGLLILMGWNQIGLDIYDSGASSFKRLILPSKKIVPFLLTAIIYRLIVSTGVILFIIPGIIWGLMYSFADLIVIDSDARMKEALRISAHITYGYKWDLLFFFFIGACITLMSAITIIGPFLLTYVLFLARVYIYRKLQERWQLEHQPPTPFMP